MRLRILRPLQVTGLLVFGLIAGLLLAEAAIRTLGGASSSGGLRSVSEGEFAMVPGTFSPNQRAVVRSIPELTHDVSINSLGYRGAISGGQKPPTSIGPLCR